MTPTCSARRSQKPCGRAIKARGLCTYHLTGRKVSKTLAARKRLRAARDEARRAEILALVEEEIADLQSWGIDAWVHCVADGWPTGSVLVHARDVLDALSNSRRSR